MEARNGGVGFIMGGWEMFKVHSMDRGINPPSKTSPPSFLSSPPLNRQTVHALPFLAILPLYWFSITPQFEFLVMTEKNIFAYKIFYH